MMPMQKVSTVGAIIVSSLCAIAFIVMTIIAYLSKDQTNLSLLTGAIIASFSTTVSFWLGSSAGSQKKDEQQVARSPDSK